MIGIGAGIGISRMRDLARLIRNMLFGAGEVGVMYDPSDFSTMYQDSAGTTPVTAVEQPVGLILDKSKGLVLGPELVTNGTFDVNTTGWSYTGTGSVVLEGSAARVTSAATTAGGILSSTDLAVTLGKSYLVTATVNVTQLTSGSIAIALFGNGTGKTLSAVGSYSISFITRITDNTTRFYAQFIGQAIGDNYLIDNISVRELPGNHATQATSTARPVTITNGIDCDGVDDAIIEQQGGGGTTGFFLCTAVSPDGGAGTARTIWSDAGTNTGYIVRLNASNQLEIAAGNGTAYTLAATTDTLSVGTTYVITAWDDGTNLNVQVNSGTAGTAERPVVSAGNAGFRIGKDYGAATGFFNGAPIVGSMVYVKNGENVDAADRAAAKTYVAGKAGVTL